MNEVANLNTKLRASVDELKAAEAHRSSAPSTFASRVAEMLAASKAKSSQKLPGKSHPGKSHNHRSPGTTQEPQFGVSVRSGVRP
jgi:hypothetical protein